MSTPVADGKSSPESQVVVGSKYTHYKGNSYLVVAIARNSETMDLMVVYRDLQGKGEHWVRPLSMFTEEVSLDGKMVPRFSLRSYPQG